MHRKAAQHGEAEGVFGAWPRSNYLKKKRKSILSIGGAMEPEFNVGQILQIAERVERNGASFYLRMANRFCDQVQQNICRGLAAWRSKQENAFAEHRRLFYEGLGELQPVDSGDYVLSHTSVMADLAVFADELYVGRALTGRERRKEIINDAIVRAEDAIIFYRG